MATGLGIQPLSWLEIQSYSEATEGIQTKVEKRLMRSMSQAYIRGLDLGKDALAIAPWKPQ